MMRLIRPSAGDRGEVQKCWDNLSGKYYKLIYNYFYFKTDFYVTKIAKICKFRFLLDFSNKINPKKC